MDLEEATIKALEGKLFENLIKVYHGTNNKFDKFKNIYHGIGYWFTTNKEYASEHGKYVLELFLDSNNILDLEDLNNEDIFLDLIREYYGRLVDEQRYFNDEKFGRFLKAKGFDGICWKHNPGITYIVFDRNSINYSRGKDE